MFGNALIKHNEFFALASSLIKMHVIQPAHIRYTREMDKKVVMRSKEFLGVVVPQICH